MRGFWQDLRVATRILFRNRAFALTVIVTLALGIGLSTTVFTIFEAVALRPLPVHHPEQVVKIYQRIVGDPGYRSFSHPEYAALREFEQLFFRTNRLCLDAARDGCESRWSGRRASARTSLAGIR